MDAAREVYKPLEVFASFREDVSGLGKDHNPAVPLGDRFDLGPDKCLASSDIVRKTHYLNELRWMTFDACGGIGRHGDQDRSCHFNVDMIIYAWVDTHCY